MREGDLELFEAYFQMEASKVSLSVIAAVKELLGDE
jgi:hypothetical protein